MRARDLNKQIEIWNTGAKVDDGFGGSTVTAPVKEGDYYAKIVSLDPGTIEKAYGGSIPQRSIRVTVRAYVELNPANHFIKYRGKEFSVNGALINEDFEDRFKSFIL